MQHAIWLFAVIAFQTEGRYAAVIFSLSNAVVIKGTEIDMSCYVDSPSRPLLRTQLDQLADSSTIYDGNRIVGKFTRLYKQQQNRSGNEFSFVMNATEETARRYICEEPGYQSVSAELIVLASDPVCSLVKVVAADEYFQVEMQCAVRYWGNWSPTMEWRKSYEKLAENSDSAQIKESVNTITNKYRTTSLLVITGKRSQELPVYSCTTKFSAEQKPVYTTTSNIPDYNYKWSSPEVTISPGILSQSFAPLLAIAVTAMVALIVTTTCLVVQKRKLKESSSQRKKEQSQFRLMSVQEHAAAANKGTLQSTDATEFKSIRDAAEQYETIELAPEMAEPAAGEYTNLSTRADIFATQEYMALAWNTNCAIETPTGDILQQEKLIEISGNTEDNSLNYKNIGLARETTQPRHSYLSLFDDTGPATQEFLEATISEMSSHHKTHNSNSAKGLDLDYLIPILSETDY